MIDPDPAKAAQQLEKWAGQLEQRSRRFTELHERMNEMTVTETAADGAVRVTVDGNGLPTELTLTERSEGMEPARLSAELMSCLRRAQAKLREQVEQTTHEMVGDQDDAGQMIVGQYAQRFPDEPDSADGGGADDRLVEIDEDNED